MKALVCPELGGEEVLRVEELPTRECGPTDVRIAVRAASVNFPDTLVIRGEYQYKYDPPFVPGHESSGTLTRGRRRRRRPRGRRSRARDDGDRRVRERGGRDAAAQRPGVPHPRRDGLGRGRRVQPHVRHRHPRACRAAAGSQAGESVLVLGAAGGTGSAAIQVAKAMGAYVIGAAGGAEKLAIAEQCGADAVVDYREEGLSARVKELTGGARRRRRVRSRRRRRLPRVPAVPRVERPLPRGRVRGRRDPVRRAQPDPVEVGVDRRCRVRRVGARRSRRATPRTSSSSSVGTTHGLLKPVIGHHFPLEQGAEALRVVSNRGALGKVIIDDRRLNRHRPTPGARLSGRAACRRRRCRAGR